MARLPLETILVKTRAKKMGRKSAGTGDLDAPNYGEGTAVLTLDTGKQLLLQCHFCIYNAAAPPVFCCCETPTEVIQQSEGH